MLRNEKEIIQKAIQDSMDRLKESFPEVNEETIKGDLGREVRKEFKPMKGLKNTSNAYYQCLRKFLRDNPGQYAMTAVKNYAKMPMAEKKRWLSYQNDTERLLEPSVQKKYHYRFRTHTDLYNFYKLKYLLQKIGRESEAHVICAVARKVVKYNHTNYVIWGTDAGRAFLDEYEELNGGGSLSANLQHFAEAHCSAVPQEEAGSLYRMSGMPRLPKKRKTTPSKTDLLRQELRESILLLINETRAAITDKETKEVQWSSFKEVERNDEYVVLRHDGLGMFIENWPARLPFKRDLPSKDIPELITAIKNGPIVFSLE